MKQLILCLLMIAINKGCAQLTKREQVLNSITYSVTTRGSSYTCSIDDKKIYIASAGTETEIKTEIISPDIWVKLYEIIGNFELKEIQNFKAPTAERALDRARIAKIIIVANKETYESQTFDEEAPPEELKPLIDMILALTETVE